MRPCTGKALSGFSKRHRRSDEIATTSSGATPSEVAQEYSRSPAGRSHTLLMSVRLGRAASLWEEECFSWSPGAGERRPVDLRSVAQLDPGGGARRRCSRRGGGGSCTWRSVETTDTDAASGRCAQRRALDMTDLHMAHCRWYAYMTRALKAVAAALHDTSPYPVPPRQRR